MQSVYSWCSKLEGLRDELKGKGQLERVTLICLEDVPNFCKACAQLGATCKLLEVESVKMSHYGGDRSDYEKKQRVRITFTE